MSLDADDSRVRRVTLGMVWLCALVSAIVVAASAPRPPTLIDLLTHPREAFRSIFKWLAAESSEWSAVAVLALILPCLVLPGLAFIFHYLDWLYGGGGIKDRLGRVPRPHSRLTSEVIAATMTKQSILAAIAAIFLAGQDVGSLASQSYPEFTAALSRLGFSVALLLLTVSVLSYDYANRFELCREECYELVRKGLRLDIFAWYILLASFIVSMAARHIITSIIISIATGFLVRWYYFLTPREFGELPKHKRRSKFVRYSSSLETLKTANPGGATDV